jgi:lipoic acid synthetase
MGDVKPSWFKVRYKESPESQHLADIFSNQSLHSVCQSAHCPNKSECWAQGTASFMVLGEFCTRGCRFCAVRTMAKPPPPDDEEPAKLAKAVSDLGLKYLVVTSVTRDDLPDGGSMHIARCILELKERNPGLVIEALVPDFRADRMAITNIIDSGPDVVSHNIETVERLSPRIRDPRASYDQSLEALRLYHGLSDGKIITKSGIMVGLGEDEGEMGRAMDDLRSAGVEILTIGQYLQPSIGPRHFPLKEYVSPERFKEYGTQAYEKGFGYVASGPLVRSSYMAAEPFIKGILRSRKKA